jgi:ubiquinol-cytochrome c reductase cytochrome b subunit
VTPRTRDARVPRKRFFPQQLFKDTIAIFVAFAALFVMADLLHVPLAKIADPSDTSYIPRPEWYFLFLFQLLKFFAGPFEIVDTVILPSLAMLALILVAFIDRRRIEKLTRRVVAISVAGVALAAWTGLTAAAIVTTPKKTNYRRVQLCPGLSLLLTIRRSYGLPVIAAGTIGSVDRRRPAYTHHAAPGCSRMMI